MCAGAYESPPYVCLDRMNVITDTQLHKHCIR